MKLTIKNGKLYDTKKRKYIEAQTDWTGHGDHDKQKLPKTKKIKYLPYKCECGAILLDLHEANIFTD